MDTLDFLAQKDVKSFIKEHVKADIQKLVLNPPAQFEREEIKLIADQILTRQKAVNKLPGWAQNFDLIMPPPLSIEQASSNATGEYKSSLISGELLIDLTGGMGIDCLSLSKGFQKTIYVEKQEVLCQTFQHNANVLQASVEIHNKDAEDFLIQFEGNQRTMFYLDPARRDDLKNRVFRLEDCTPNVTKLISQLKKKGSGALIKLSPLLDLTKIISSVSHIKEIHIVSVKNDCKEILLNVDFKYDGGIQIVCVNLQTDQKHYTYQWHEEAETSVKTGEPASLIYEPNSSIMKAGAFKKIAEDFNLAKISSNTHLYTSKKEVSNFPGKTFQIKSFIDRKNLKELKGKTINVITRNYPQNSNELKKQMKIKDGGREFLLAFRDSQNKPTMVIADRLDS